MIERLADALEQAADAHRTYERKIGRPNPDWPRWYARHMMGTLDADEDGGEGQEP